MADAATRSFPSPYVARYTLEFYVCHLVRGDYNPVVSVGAIADEIRRNNFASVRAEQMRSLLPQAVAGWKAFAASWQDLGLDTFMADGGRYRRRRFGAFSLSADGVLRKPHQPHYQSRDYNALNGGIERWFEPITDDVADGACLQSILRFALALHGLTPADRRPASWHTECHQFRIEARPGEQGQPTPEGLHRDGVDWVLVMLVKRENIAEGVTSIHDSERRMIGRFTLTEPLDSAFVDDGRAYHGVTAVAPIDRTRLAHRDVLVVTMRRE